MMKASEIMTGEVVSVRPDTPIRQIARVLRDKSISAVPVIDETGAPVGIVSEGDLIGRDEINRETRQDWWLSLLAEGEMLNPNFLANICTKESLARDVMSAPIVTVGEDTDACEIARLLNAYRFKRAPVVRDGRVVGIVSRADLLRVLAEQPVPTAPHNGRLLTSAITALDERFFNRYPIDQPESAAPPSEPDDTGLKAADFQKLVAEFERKEIQHRDNARRAEAERNRRRMQRLTDDHVSEKDWRALLQQARRAAEHGETEFMLLRFPSQLCSDGGRAINVPDRGWPASLRGDAAEIYLRWRRDLKPRGFPLTARVIEFPDGVPGDIGLFLVWGQSMGG